MKIQTNLVGNKYNFGAQPLYPLNVKQKVDNGYITVPAHFCEIDYIDSDDVDLVIKMNKKWVPKNPLENYIDTIAKNFVKAIRKKETRKYFVLQVDIPTLDDYAKTVSIIETTNPSKFNEKGLEIIFLQSINSIYKILRKFDVKGAGEQIIAGAVQYAKDNNYDFIKLFSTKDSFYDKIGFRCIERGKDGSIFFLSKYDYDNFLNKTKEKYGK